MSETSHSQYGNNFFLLFEAIRTGSNASEFASIKLKKAEGLGGVWEVFLQENNQLIKAAVDALNKVEQYRILMQQYNQLNKAKKWDEADDFEKDTNFELVGINAWNNLNPILKEIGEKMAEYNMDEKDFWG